MSEVSMVNFNRVQFREDDYTQRGQSRTIKKLLDEQKVLSQKVATGKEYTSYSEMNMGFAEENLTLASDLSSLISANSALDAAKSDINELSNGLASVISLTESFKIDISKFELADKNLNKNAIIKTVKEFKSTLQGVLNSRSSSGDEYIFSGQKVGSEPVDLSQGADRYYKGSEFNKELSLYSSSYEFSFNAGDESIKSLVDVINNLMQDGNYSPDEVKGKLAGSISKLTASKYQIDSTSKHMEDFSKSLSEKSIRLNDRFQEINHADQSQIIIDLNKNYAQLKAIGQSLRYVNFQMADYL